MASPLPPDGSTPGPEVVEFTFVTGQNQQSIRSHAMREAWKLRRHKHHTEAKKKRERRPPRHILPNNEAAKIWGQVSTQSASDTELATESQTSNTSPSEYGAVPWSDALVAGAMPPWAHGIPAQALSGMNLALGSGMLDPFDRFPVKLTALHHKLLHHWLSTYSTMVFDTRLATSFNPMRDVWLPLDLSNAASFYALMAHSAAHLARMQGLRRSEDALDFKARAVHIVTSWINENGQALSDDILAAVLRLMTFERNWGTEAEWHVHHDGFLNMIEARGGIAALQNNWRLVLTAFLVSLMSKPTWFNSSNEILTISTQSLTGRLHPALEGMEGLKRIRGLWLVSFVQDIGSLMHQLMGLSQNGLARCAALKDAILLLKTNMRQARATRGETDVCNDQEFKRLSTLLLLCVLLTGPASGQGSSPNPNSIPGVSVGSRSLEVMFSLNHFLEQTRQLWQDSVANLRVVLFDQFASDEEGVSKADYVSNMARVVESMAADVRQGVDGCLLRILCPPAEDDGDDEWTPDSLLSSIHS